MGAGPNAESLRLIWKKLDGWSLRGFLKRVNQMESTETVQAKVKEDWCVWDVEVFPTREDARAYCRAKGLPLTRIIKIKESEMEEAMAD